MAVREVEKVMSEVKQAFEGGATRTEQAGRYDLIPVAAMDALARRLALGAKKHGERNWEKGGPEFEKATLSHGIAHLMQYAQTGRQDDLDGAICNLEFLCHFRAKLASAEVFGATPERVGEVEELVFRVVPSAILRDREAAHAAGR